MLEVKDQKVKEVRSQNQEVLDKLDKDPSWRPNRIKNPIVFSIAFSLSTN